MCNKGIKHAEGEDEKLFMINSEETFTGLWTFPFFLLFLVQIKISSALLLRDDQMCK